MLLMAWRLEMSPPRTDTAIVAILAMAGDKAIEGVSTKHGNCSWPSASRGLGGGV